MDLDLPTLSALLLASTLSGFVQIHVGSTQRQALPPVGIAEEFLDVNLCRCVGDQNVNSSLVGEVPHPVVGPPHRPGSDAEVGSGGDEQQQDKFPRTSIP